MHAKESNKRKINDSFRPFITEHVYLYIRISIPPNDKVQNRNQQQSLGIFHISRLLALPTCFFLSPFSLLFFILPNCGVAGFWLLRRKKPTPQASNETKYDATKQLKRPLREMLKSPPEAFLEASESCFPSPPAPWFWPFPSGHACTP